jgi:hypothetical protein
MDQLKMRILEVWIPGVVASVNTFRRRGTRGRMTTIKTERDKAQMLTLKAVREKYPSGLDQWIGPTSIDFEIRTARVFKDHLQVGGALKSTQDGVCLAVLPHGDGQYIPGTKVLSPYQWREPTQVKVKTRKEEGVLVTIRTMGPVEPAKGL